MFVNSNIMILTKGDVDGAFQNCFAMKLMHMKGTTVMTENTNARTGIVALRSSASWLG